MKLFPNRSVHDIYVQYTGSMIELERIQSVLLTAKSFFLNFLENVSPFCGATDTSVLDSGATPTDHLAAKNIRIYNYIHRHQFIVSSAALLTELF